MSKSPAPERLNHLPEAAMQSSFSTVRAYLHVIVFFALTLGTGFLPPPGITEMGMNILGVFLGLLYGWSFIGFAWPSMICLVALGFTGYAEPAAIIASASQRRSLGSSLHISSISVISSHTDEA